MRIRLRYKLFALLLLANAALASAILYANSRAFSDSFDTYLNQVQYRRLSPLLDRLADEYRREGSWDFVDDRAEHLARIGRRFFWPEHRRGRSERPGEPDYRRARQGSGDKPDPPMQLRSASGELVWRIGASDKALSWYAIEVDGEAVGELGVPRNLRLMHEFDQVFAEQQRRQLFWITLIALSLAAAIAIPFAAAIVRPISRLQGASARLAAGDYSQRLPEQGRDELADLARDFNHLAAALADNLSARQRWVADISHELRTPVAVLQAELEALRDGISRPDPETLNSLHQEILRLGRLIGDLHELSLADAGALSYRMHSLDLMAVLRQALEHARPLMAQRCISCTLKGPDTAVPVRGDNERLTQLFNNLIRNTLDYTEGSAEQPGTLVIEVQVTPEQVWVSWQDSPPGVPDEALSHLFERLYRVDGSRDRASGGSGLGLAIAREIVHAHGGEIRATHSPLGGLALRLTLPAARV
ncbi:ATP-binding protein [Marinimicrobium alkaliphilum]|uniref:ATP-binding protein n=1 Tax=Marinimicrobium alkaliphilum TaxID=2202654 RepID=UPI000DB94568|nr:ATP-binding protein [Marinimicrobium alkaliphilum]